MNRETNPSSARLSLILISLLIASVLTSFGVNTALSQQAPLQSKSFRGTLPIFNPEDKMWNTAPPLQVPLAWQNITKPMLLGPSIRSLTVRSINNGTWIAFLIEWGDKTRNATIFKTEQFRDAVAIMLPTGNETQPPFLGMGEQGKPVNIWHWKSDWQEDVDELFQDLEKAHPNLWVDYYPFATAGPPYSIPPLVNHSAAFVTGWAAGNPLSNPVKATPVEDLIAEGFGTLTSQSHQDVIGRGVWKDGVWKVVFARPMTTSDPSDAQLQPGRIKNIAFAVWDGGNREVDGRKSFSNWHTIRIEAGVLAEVEEGILVPVPVWRWIVVGSVFLLSIAILVFAGSIGSRRRAVK